MANPFSDIKPVQKECVWARHPTREEQLDQLCKLLAQGSCPLKAPNTPKEKEN